VDEFDLTRPEQVRLVAWLVALGVAVLAWNGYLWALGDPDEGGPSPTWLLQALISTAVALGVLGGLLVPRQRASLVSLLTACSAAAIVVATTCFLAWIALSGSGDDADNPFALGLGAGFVAVSSSLFIAPSFGAGYFARTMVARGVRRTLKATRG
jgi:hypothetical protein